MPVSHPRAFVPSAPSLRRARRPAPHVCPSRHVIHRQHDALRHLHPRLCKSSSTALRLPGFPLVAVQANPVSGDSDGEVDSAPPQKSYSVGVTIVSGCDARLRRNVIEKIVADSPAGRVVVVTTSGITSTDEPDGQLVPAAPADADAPDGANADEAVAPAPSTAQLNGHAPSTPLTGDVKTSPAVKNLEGWISCSSPEEMAEVVVKLATSRECDYIIAEGSMESAEPQELAHLLQARCGASLRIDTLVSVLDGDTLLEDLSALPTRQDDEDALTDGDAEGNASAETPAPMHDTTDTRPMMVVSLVENANVVIVNQSNQEIPPDQLSRLQNLVSVLNGSASIVSATEEAVPVDQLVNTNAYDHESTMLGATWKKVLIASRNAEKSASKPMLPKSLKDSAFVYRARRPFHPTRLYQHIKAVATFAGVIRSTGRIWLATRMLAPLEWNQAGVAATLRVGKLFWAAVPESDWPLDEAERDKIMQNWDTQYGDRETEIVFVGMGIDKVRLQGLLDGCLLQDEEMVFTNLWENFDDPFVEWVPLIEEDEDLALTNDPAVEEDARGQARGAESHPGKAPAESELGLQMSPLEQREEPEETDPEEEEEDASTARLEGDQIEGVVQESELPDDVVERLSALDIFDKGFSDDSSAAVVAQPQDDGSFDEEDAVIASWDGAIADDILTQVPKKGLPVTIVTGFLGSGKTTLLNYILTADHGLRIAVLVNEFGEIDIDNQLVEKGDWSNKDEVMELANGCICCSINDSFVSAVSQILERSDDVDYLIVETTGVADPVPVINSLMASDVAEDVRVDGILTVVDAENFDPQTQMGSEAALSQIMAADTILLSKTDIASPEKVEETIEYIKSVRPAARILKSQRGRVPIKMILDVGVRVADSPAHLNPVKKEGANDAHAHKHEHGSGHKHDDTDEHEFHEPSHDHDHDHDHSHDHECEPDCTHESHAHDHSNHLEADGFVTTSFKSDRPLDPDLFMNNFLQRLPEGVFRAKGLLRFYGYGNRYVFQLSGRRYQFEEDNWPEGVAPGNQMVIIGRDLDLEDLRSTLESCLAEE